MDKKKILEKFPILRKIRTKQIKFVFYAKMYLDKNKYCKEIINENCHINYLNSKTEW